MIHVYDFKYFIVTHWAMWLLAAVDRTVKNAKHSFPYIANEVP